MSSLPPMLEGIIWVGDQLVAVSESGAKGYKTPFKAPLDTLITLPLDSFTK